MSVRKRRSNHQHQQQNRHQNSSLYEEDGGDDDGGGDDDEDGETSLFGSMGDAKDRKRRYKTSLTREQWKREALNTAKQAQWLQGDIRKIIKSQVWCFLALLIVYATEFHTDHFLLPVSLYRFLIVVNAGLFVSIALTVVYWYTRRIQWLYATIWCNVALLLTHAVIFVIRITFTLALFSYKVSLLLDLFGAFVYLIYTAQFVHMYWLLQQYKTQTYRWTMLENQRSEWNHVN